MNDQYLKGVLGMISSALLFSLMALLIRLGVGISFFTTSFYRFAVGVCILATLAMFKKIKLEFHNVPLLFLRGLLGGISVVTFYMAISKIGIAKGTVLTYTYPLFATVGGVLFLKNRVRTAVWILLGIGLAGIALLMGLFTGTFTWADLNLWTILTLVGAITAGFAVVSIKKLTQTDSSYSIFIAQCLIGFWIVAVPANTTSLHLGWMGGLLLVAIGLTATASQLIMTGSYKHVSVVTGSLLSLLTPIFNVAFGLLLFKEQMVPHELMGTALILLSCLAVVMVGKERLPARR